MGIHSGPSKEVLGWLEITMPAPGKGRVPIVKLTVALPAPLYDEIEDIVRSEGRWLSVVDFVRFSVGNEVERRRGKKVKRRPRTPAP